MHRVFLDVKEDARRLGRAPKTIHNRLSKGTAPELQAVKVWGRWVIPAQAVEEMLKNK